MLAKISTMELVEHKTLEGERVFPSFWLFPRRGATATPVRRLGLAFLLFDVGVYTAQK